ncbi:putative polyprotein [Tanacetum coccineum]
MFSRMSKLEFCKFYGDDVKGWMLRIKQFFTLDGVHDEDRIKMVFIHLFDQALTWHLQFIKTHGQAVAWDVTTTTLALPALNNQTVTKYPPSSVSTPRKLLKEEECLEEEEEEESDMIAYELSNQTPQSSPHISLNALSGIPTHNNIRVRVHIRNRCPLEVSIAGGSKLISQYMVKAFQWKLQRIVFEIDVMLLPLGGCEMVLGIQWLYTLGTIQWNFKDLVMKFQYAGQKVVLRGTNKFELTWLSGRHMSNGQEMVLGADFAQLLQEYADVFEVPIKLPPQRSFDHKIPLKEDNVTINIRPYRYPLGQKDTIEAMVKELLDSGVIRPSNSPFSSPIVMVFSKLDLRSGYHKIRMCESDVYKTTFKIHEGHYEFVVMPFGLINAPSTFQALMNLVFKTFLRKFTLVFFDDILVYSPSTLEHIKHLRMVLQVIREHHLFAKQSKCVFGTTQVEYLGHVISIKGVSTDPKTDASGIRLGAVLQQNKHPIAYLSKTLAPKHQSLSTYEKELLAMRLTTLFQSKWLPKLLGFDYEIEYKKGADNAAVDALSRIERQGVLFSMLAGTSNELMDAVIAT